MDAFLQQNYAPVLAMGIILAIILFATGISRKLVRLIIGIVILIVLVPMLFTIFWGNGFAYITKIASYLTPNQQQQIEVAYAYFKERDAEDPIINYDAVFSKITDVFTSVQELENEGIQETVDHVKEKAEE